MRAQHADKLLTGASATTQATELWVETYRYRLRRFAARHRTNLRPRVPGAPAALCVLGSCYCYSRRSPRRQEAACARGGRAGGAGGRVGVSGWGEALFELPQKRWSKFFLYF